MEPIYALISSIAALALCQAVVGFWRASKSVSHHVGPRMAFSSTTILGAFILPRIPGIASGSNALFREKFQPFLKYGWDVYVEISWLGKQITTFYVADPKALKTMASNRARFPKPTQDYEVLAVYGDNVLTTEGDQWRKYKKLVSPAFTDRNNRFVWTETIRIVSELFEEVWGDQRTIDVDHANDLTTQIAIKVIGSAIFGQKGSWIEDDVKPPGHRMSFNQALYKASSDLLIKAAVTSFALSWTSGLRKTQLAFEELGAYLEEMVEERTQSPDVSRDDLFSSLLASNASVSKSGADKLDAKELSGNLFIFLVAGHETTAHTLCFALALLAMYPDEQEKLYSQITAVCGDGRLASYEMMPLLTRPLAVFYEALRMFPVITGVPKCAAEDTTITFENQDGRSTTVPMPKGSKAMLNISAMHYNPRYWSNPHEFKPDRFLESSWPKDAFFPFSGGPRACIGRRFAETEGVAVLTTIISKYRVSIKEEQAFSEETVEQRRERVLRTTQAISLTPVRVPLSFTRRN